MKTTGYLEGNYEQISDIYNFFDCMEEVNRYDINATGVSYYQVSYKEGGSCYAHYGISMTFVGDVGYQFCYISGKN